MMSEAQQAFNRILELTKDMPDVIPYIARLVSVQTSLSATARLARVVVTEPGVDDDYILQIIFDGAPALVSCGLLYATEVDAYYFVTLRDGKLETCEWLESYDMFEQKLTEHALSYVNVIAH